MLNRLNDSLIEEKSKDNNSDKINNLQNIIDHQNTKFEEIESQMHILENTGQIFELQHQIEIDLVNLEENNRRVLDELSLQHEEELDNIENQLEQQYMSK